MNGVTAMDENGEEIKSPIKRLGSTRKLILFNSKYIVISIVIATQFCIIPIKKKSHTKVRRRVEYLVI